LISARSLSMIGAGVPAAPTRRSTTILEVGHAALDHGACRRSGRRVGRPRRSPDAVLGTWPRRFTRGGLELPSIWLRRSAGDQGRCPSRHDDDVGAGQHLERRASMWRGAPLGTPGLPGDFFGIGEPPARGHKARGSPQQIRGRPTPWRSNEAHGS
jgi:hypothetical protein